MEAPHTNRKITSIQLLRAIAASTVAVLHEAFAFADHIGAGFGVARFGGHAGQSAVALFFVVSGYIMVVSSRRLFGQPGATQTFWTRRLIRIMPPYWIATALLVSILVWRGQSIDPAALGKSLLLIPHWNSAAQLHAHPLLWVGWTLFYELLFYALFGLFLPRGRTVAVLGSVAGLVGLTLAGTIVPQVPAFLYVATRPLILTFIGGMALAMLHEQGRAIGAGVRIAALFGSVVAFMLIRHPGSEYGFGYLLWSGLPALLFAVAVVGGPLDVPFPRVVERAGDMSYALYLLHLPIAWTWIYLYQRAFHPHGPWMFFITLLGVTYVLSWLFFKWVERPMTQRLNAMLARPSGDTLLQQTGV